MNETDIYNHSLLEIDQEIAELAPQLRRKMHQEEVWAQIDPLLDQRNIITAQLGDLMIEEYEKSWEK